MVHIRFWSKHSISTVVFKLFYFFSDKFKSFSSSNYPTQLRQSFSQPPKYFQNFQNNQELENGNDLPSTTKHLEVQIISKETI